MVLGNRAMGEVRRAIDSVLRRGLVAGNEHKATSPAERFPIAGRMAEPRLAVCPYCGKEVVLEANFCSGCGHRIPLWWSGTSELL